MPAENRFPLSSSCCLELWGLFCSDVGVGPLLLLLRGNAPIVVYSHMMNTSCRVLDIIVWWDSLSVYFGILHGSSRLFSSVLSPEMSVGLNCLVPLFSGSSLLNVVRNVGVRTFALSFFFSTVWCNVVQLFVLGFNIHCSASGQLLRRPPTVHATV